jgi:DNA adenine methylase
VIQNHLEEFVRHFKWMLYHREEFERQKALPPERLTDIQRAMRFYYIQRNCFGGRINSTSFGTSVSRAPKLNLLRIEEDLSAAHLRLARVYLENKPYADVIRQYDRARTFFYVDPPYWGCEDYYGKMLFSRDDFSNLADVLAGIKGRFLLSLNDVPEIREIFKAFTIEPVSLRYSVGQNDGEGKELFITNY